MGRKEKYGNRRKRETNKEKEGTAWMGKESQRRGGEKRGSGRKRITGGREGEWKGRYRRSEEEVERVQIAGGREDGWKAKE